MIVFDYSEAPSAAIAAIKPQRQFPAGFESPSVQIFLI
jgi:hypothetical protein